MQSKAKLGVYAKINEESAFSERLLWTRDRWHFTSTTLFTHSPYEPYEAGISDFTAVEDLGNCSVSSRHTTVR